MDVALLVLAAGMGSRYGGLKQMDEFGPGGETILDYSIYDAIEAGFKKVVFVVRNSFKSEFQDFFKDKFEDKVEVAFVTQELEDIPKEFDLDPKREKPWGTAHAVYVAHKAISEPFAVINADDYYGKSSYKTLFEFFQKNNLEDREKYCLVSYLLSNTLSDHGTVNRGICEVNKNNELSNVVETLKIGYNAEKEIVFNDNGQVRNLAPTTPVSMNMWGFYPSYFDYFRSSFESFLHSRGKELKAEYFIPLIIDELIKSKKESVEVLSCDAEWFGVTYKEDKAHVVNRLNLLIAKGEYPLSLWS